MCIGKIYINIKNVYLKISGATWKFCLSILINQKSKGYKMLGLFFLLLIFNPVLFYKDIYVVFFLIKV